MRGRRGRAYVRDQLCFASRRPRLSSRLSIPAATVPISLAGLAVAGMPPKTDNSGSDEPDYLSPSFDPNSLVMSKLRGLLFQVSIAFHVLCVFWSAFLMMFSIS
jgi:hypothetical protein